MAISIADFGQEKECMYKDERYAVRDNGAVFRYSREGMRMRKDDNHWTFGKPDAKMYLKIGTEFVHRIVATAFHSTAPTPQHVVDHRDTNRKNNRPENLRWLTRLENILNNPITVKRIVYRCGSIEAFLKDPSILKDHLTEDPNFEWMRAVTPQEAALAWERLSNWAKKGSYTGSNKSEPLGDWLYYDNHDFLIPQTDRLTASLTPNAVQKDWRTPSEFPGCPNEPADDPMDTYAANLNPGALFCRNEIYSSTVSDFALSEDHQSLYVISGPAVGKGAFKPWGLAKITFEEGFFVHASLGTFFTQKGAEKEFVIGQGLEWHGGETFDDQC